MSQKEGWVSEEVHKKLEKQNKDAIEKMVGQSYIPHRKPNERISVKEFSQEGEKEMVVFDEIRLDQGPTPRSMERRLSINDFFYKYVTLLRKARLDESYKERFDEENNMKKETNTKEGEDKLSLSKQIEELKKEKELLLKERYSSFSDIGRQKINLDRIKVIDAEIAKLEKRLEVINVKPEEDIKESYLKPEDMQGDLSRFIGRKLVVSGRGEGTILDITSKGALMLDWKRYEDALPLTPEEGEKPFNPDLIRKWGQGIDALSVIETRKVGVDEGEYFRSFPIKKQIQFLENECNTIWGRP